MTVVLAAEIIVFTFKVVIALAVAYWAVYMFQLVTEIKKSADCGVELLKKISYSENAIHSMMYNDAVERVQLKQMLGDAMNFGSGGDGGEGLGDFDEDFGFSDPYSSFDKELEEVEESESAENSTPKKNKAYKH